MDTSLLVGAALLLVGLLVGLAVGTRLRPRGPAPGEEAAAVSAVAEVLRPAGAALSRLEAELHRVERERVGSYAGLREQLVALHRQSADLGRQTRSLVDVLRHPGARGRWGELQLRRLVELSGMVEHCDFREQVTVDGDTTDGAGRPDLVIQLAGDRVIPVDAKVPLQAWLAAADLDGDRSLSPAEHASRSAAAARDHARALRSHVDALSRKAYWREFRRAPEFVVMFVPGDGLLETALRSDPELLEHAFARDVVIATPTTLFALLRTVAQGWRGERLSESAEQVHRLGRELLHRFGVFADHLTATGSALARSVETYNAAVRSFDSRLLPAARRLAEESGAREREHAVRAVTRAPLPPNGHVTTGAAGPSGSTGPPGGATVVR